MTTATDPALPACRSCTQCDLELFLDLGHTPLANALIPADQLDATEETFPLRVAFCKSCSLVQLVESVPPERLFRSYVYFSSFSDAMLAHAKRLTTRCIAERKLGPNSLVIEAASNDGYLLQNYSKAGIPVLGIEPAREAAHVARQRGIETVEEFFTEALAEKLASDGIQADLFHAHNVLAHVPDLNGFLAGVRRVLKPTGTAVVEAPYLRDLIEHCEFDTIYHEHLFYFSVTALHAAFARNGLTLYDVEHVRIHGGSLRLFFGPDASIGESRNVTRFLIEERTRGMATADYYRDFADRVSTLRDNLRKQCAQWKAEGKRIAAYGASAKGSTLLNYCKIGRETIDFVADRSTVKQGLYTPGTHMPIVPTEALTQQNPDYVLLLTWNFEEEILRQQSAYREQGGQFVVPVPYLRVA